MRLLSGAPDSCQGSGVFAYCTPARRRHRTPKSGFGSKDDELSVTADTRRLENVDKRSTVCSEHKRRHVRTRTMNSPGAQSYWRYRQSPAWSLLVSLILLFLPTTPVFAAKLPFQNCLSDDYLSATPPKLQFAPAEVHAFFDTENPSHKLEVIVYGNVTGSYNRVTLPGEGDPHWSDVTQTDGKILRQPEGEQGKATTLFRHVDVLTYRPYQQPDVDFCSGGLGAGVECPLGPVWRVDDFPYGLPTINITGDVNSSYVFTSFTPNFQITYGDVNKTTIACITATVTPDLGDYARIIEFIPLLVLALTGFATIFAAIWSPWGTTDIFHWTSNYGRDTDLLRLVTPGFGDCLHHIQFAVLTGSLSLSYPGFYQPIVGQVAWSALLFNHTIATNGSTYYQPVQDGVYVLDGSYGLHRLGQLVGLELTADLWPGMMVWLCVVVGSVTVLAQAAFLLQWIYRKIRKTSEEDLRSKNIPFSVGNVVRIVFNFFLLPIVSLSCFQLVVAADSTQAAVAIAALTVVAIVAFTAWVFRLILRAKPKSILFDDLPTVLQYGPLYNTYSDQAAAFALVSTILTIIRGIAIGAVQPSGIAQIILLAICEVVFVFALHASRPYHPGTSMNAYHTVFAFLRLITILMMVAFIPQLSVADSAKGWVGYAVLLVHGAFLILGFLINALQTIFEVTALMLGAGGDDAHGLTRGGLSKIFGMRQLSRRPGPRAGPSRASQLSSAAMLDQEDNSKNGFAMPSGRVRSESAGSLNGMLVPRHRSSSALDSIDMYAGYHRPGGSVSSYMPGDTPQFSAANTPTLGRGQGPALPMEAAGPYYRPPRRRQETMDSQPESQRGSIHVETKQRQSLGPGPLLGDAGEMGAEISRGPTPANAIASLANIPNRPDYSTREVDFYYGVTRGPALNSDGAGRRLGTGPADPTGPVATATGWLRGFLGGKTKEKGKGFEVVRSARMPPAMMARNGEHPEGIPVAMGVLRNGPIDSDDEDQPVSKAKLKARPGTLLTETGEPRGPDEDEPDSPATDRLPRGSKPLQRQDTLEQPPEVPRKSSKRNSALIESSKNSAVSDHGAESSSKSIDEPGQSSEAAGTGIIHSRLPFERTASQKRRLSNPSSMEISIDLSREPSTRLGERPASFGLVSQHSISRVDPQHGDTELFGASAELVDEPLHDRR
ncbi:unnamed protein product [Clonostachys byssicola]|uniref:ML-like domain-containing protein n=1 Tax=Clonostachys byssicola TaxID=160290 RepID=A0A9N9UV86_9HYPO|nr:unnamed protein product [Clonostachys byssicola]